MPLHPSSFEVDPELIPGEPAPYPFGGFGNNTFEYLDPRTFGWQSWSQGVEWWESLSMSEQSNFLRSGVLEIANETMNQWFYTPYHDISGRRTEEGRDLDSGVAWGDYSQLNRVQEFRNNIRDNFRGTVPSDPIASFSQAAQIARSKAIGGSAFSERNNFFNEMADWFDLLDSMDFLSRDGGFEKFMDTLVGGQEIQTIEDLLNATGGELDAYVQQGLMGQGSAFGMAVKSVSVSGDDLSSATWSVSSRANLQQAYFDAIRSAVSQGASISDLDAASQWDQSKFDWIASINDNRVNIENDIEFFWDNLSDNFSNVFAGGVGEDGTFDFASVDSYVSDYTDPQLTGNAGGGTGGTGGTGNETGGGATGGGTEEEPLDEFRHFQSFFDRMIDELRDTLQYITGDILDQIAPGLQEYLTSQITPNGQLDQAIVMSAKNALLALDSALFRGDRSEIDNLVSDLAWWGDFAKNDFFLDMIDLSASDTTGTIYNEPPSVQSTQSNSIYVRGEDGAIHKYSKRNRDGEWVWEDQGQPNLEDAPEWLRQSAFWDSANNVWVTSGEEFTGALTGEGGTGEEPTGTDPTGTDPTGGNQQEQPLPRSLTGDPDILTRERYRSGTGVGGTNVSFRQRASMSLEEKVSGNWPLTPKESQEARVRGLIAQRDARRLSQRVPAPRGGPRVLPPLLPLGVGSDSNGSGGSGGGTPNLVGNAGGIPNLKDPVVKGVVSGLQGTGNF